jgi:glycosyltransferase involved in cell wall biosynthesis
VAPFDCAEAANAVARLLTDLELRTRFGTAGRRKAEQHYDVRANVARTWNLLESLIASP